MLIHDNSEDLKEMATNAARWEPALNTLQVHTSSIVHEFMSKLNKK